MTLAPPLPATGWRTGLPARLGVAVVVGALTGATSLLAGTLMPVAQVPVGCQPNGAAGKAACAIFGPLVGWLIGAFFWLVVVGLASLGAGFAFGGLSAWLLRVRLGVVGPLCWPVMLWVIATLLRPAGVIIHLSGIAVPGYIALAFLLATTLTAPQIRLATRLIATGVLGVGFVVVLAMT